MRVLGHGSLASLIAALLGVGFHLIRILLALSVCLLAVAPWVDPPRIELGFEVPAAFEIEAAAHPLTTAPAGVANIHLENARGALRFSPASPLVVSSLTGALIALLAVILWGLSQLRAVFRTLGAARPFVPANARRIRRIGLAVMAGEVVRATCAYVGMRYAMTSFAIEGVRFEARPDLNVLALVCGLVILVIAEVFREGTRLDEEQSLTV